jgi:transketolase
VGNLTLIVDANGLQGLGSTTDITDLEPLGEKLSAFGWDVTEVGGHDHDALREVLATPAGERPHAVIARTVKGYGWSSMENDVMSHYRSIPASDRELVLAEIDSRSAA